MSKCVQITGYIEEKGKQLFPIGSIVSVEDAVADRWIRVKAAEAVDGKAVAGLINQAGENTFKAQTAEIKKLTATIESQAKELGTLKTDNETLKTENKQVWEENDQLKKQIKELQDKKGKEKDSK